MSNSITKLVLSSYKGISSGVKTVSKDISSTKSYLLDNARSGWSYGRQVSKKKDLSTVEGLYTKTKFAVKQTKLRKQDLPAVAGLIGAFSPIPGGSLIGYGLGKLIQFLRK